MTAAAAVPRGLLRVVTPWVRPEAARLSIAVTASVVEIGCRLLSPWPLAIAVDSALGGKPLPAPLSFLDGLGQVGLLVVAGLSLVLLTAAGGALDLVTESTTARAAERIGGQVRQAVFQHALTLSLRWHDRMRSGEVVSRLTSDVARVLGAVIGTVTALLPHLLQLAGAVVLLFLVDPVLACLGLAVLPVLAWLSARKRRQVRAAEMDAREAAGEVAAVATDLLRNVRAVQAFGRLDRAAALFRGPNRRMVDREVRAVTLSARWAPVLDLVLAVGAGVVLVAGGLRVLAGILTVGQLIVVLAYLDDLESPVRGLVRLAGTRAKATASALRLREVLDCTEAVPEPEEPLPAPPVSEGLRLERVSFAYSPDRPVLEGFDLTVCTGETVCLFGPSGAGKSTVLHLLLRLYDPDAGRVLLDGVDIRDLSLEGLRRLVAFVPQDPWLLDGTLAENIALGSPEATRAGVLAAGRAAWVDEFAATLPEGYDTPLGESGGLLSGGQRRRIAIARAVISSAPVVLLDEPTTSLDAESARQVIGAIRSATRDRTVVLVTHDPVLAAIADRTVPVTPRWRAATGTDGVVPAGTAGLPVPTDGGGMAPVPATTTRRGGGDI